MRHSYLQCLSFSSDWRNTFVINATFEMVRPITNARILVRTDFEGKCVSIYLENTYSTMYYKI